VLGTWYSKGAGYIVRLLFNARNVATRIAFKSAGPP
jgi:hypothetical protein